MSEYKQYDGFDALQVSSADPAAVYKITVTLRAPRAVARRVARDIAEALPRTAVQTIEDSLQHVELYRETALQP